MKEMREDCKFFKQLYTYNEKLDRMDKIGYFICKDSNAKTCSNCNKYLRVEGKKDDVKYSILCRLSMLALELKAFKKLVIEAKLDKNCKKEGKKM